MASTRRPTRTPKYLAPWRGDYKIWITDTQLSRYNKALAEKNDDIKANQRIIDIARSRIKNYEELKNNAYVAWIGSGKTDTASYNSFTLNSGKIVEQESIIQTANAKIDSIKTKNVSEVNKKFLSEYLKGVKVSSKSTSKKTNSSSVTTTDATLKPPFAYKYNAPMVKTAYMSGYSPQAISAANPDLITSPGNFKNAANEAWKTSGDNGIAGAKGVIQMSSFLAQHTKITDTAKKQAFFDESMYGFKFLYNPNSVSMTWGINTEVNTQMESMGLDKSVPLTSGLFNSTITFELLLNRIEDMNYINESGLISSNAGSPYPSPVSTNDLKMIYKKGTMYDIEYLFRAVNGYNAQYNSSLNGLTADRGWLYALPIELHLGDGLHYLVRLTTLNVNHNMFNERMVPTLTTVSLTCTRYYDGPEQTYSKDKK